MLREGDDVVVRPVALATTAFIQTLAAGCPLGEATATASVLCSADPFDLAGTLTLLIRHGELIAWLSPGACA